MYIVKRNASSQHRSHKTGPDRRFFVCHAIAASNVRHAPLASSTLRIICTALLGLTGETGRKPYGWR